MANSFEVRVDAVTNSRVITIYLDEYLNSSFNKLPDMVEEAVGNFLRKEVDTFLNDNKEKLLSIANTSSIEKLVAESITNTLVNSLELKLKEKVNEGTDDN